jgi:hypothetical protein
MNYSLHSDVLGDLRDRCWTSAMISLPAIQVRGGKDCALLLLADITSRHEQWTLEL